MTLVATANGTAGGPYTLTVGVGGPYSAAFALTNLAAPPNGTYTVGTAADHAGGLTSAATCRTAGNTTCALRDALAYATSGTDTVVFKGGIGAAITLVAANGPLVVGTNMTIAGPGAAQLAVDGNNAVTVFFVASGVAASVSGLTIQRGKASVPDPGDGTRSIGGGIFNNGTLTVTNTIVARNAAYNGGPDLSGTVATGGYNLFGTTSGATITLGPGDLVNPNPLLGPLGSNGGPTQTVLLLQGSPAIDAGSDAVCAAAPVGGRDQRGTARPTGAHCDIGAYETGVINPEPGPRQSGLAGGSPSALPGARPVNAPGGPAPNPLPPGRP